MYVMQFDNHIYMCTVSLTIIVYTHCVINLQQVRWNCKEDEEEGPSAVVLQSVIFCSPPLQSTVSLPILMGLSAKMAELQRQQQKYKYNITYDKLYFLHMTIEILLPIYIKFTYIYIHLPMCIH